MNGWREEVVATLKIRLDDQVFTDSPDAGDPACLCSRCGNVIEEDDLPVRAWNEDRSLEWRWHPACIGLTCLTEPSETVNTMQEGF